MSEANALIEIDRVLKRYQALRPLRISRLRVARTDRVNLFGFDAAAAEMFVHLVTGAALADEGEIRVDGRDTRTISTDSEWLASLDRFGIVTHRAILLEHLSIAANLALPLTLSIDPLPAGIRAAVEALAADVGLGADRLDQPAGSLSDPERVRVHVARAMALQPSLLLMEHPTSRLTPDDAEGLGEVVERLADTRGVGWIALTEDQAFARRSGGTSWRLVAATGELRPERRPWPWRRA